MINAKTQMENAGGWTVAGRGGKGKKKRALKASWRRWPSVKSII